MSHMNPKISIITLGVNDLLTATAFYEKGLGLPLSSHSSENISFFDLDGTWLALYPKTALAEDANINMRSNNGEFSGITLAHNVNSKQEVNRILSIAESSGAKITKPAQDTFWGGYSGYFCDMDGYLWEVAWNPHFQIK